MKSSVLQNKTIWISLIFFYTFLTVSKKKTIRKARSCHLAAYATQPSYAEDFISE